MNSQKESRMKPKTPNTSPSKLLAIPSPTRATDCLQPSRPSPAKDAPSASPAARKYQVQLGGRSGLGGRRAANRVRSALTSGLSPDSPGMRTTRRRSRIRSGRNASSHRVMGASVGRPSPKSSPRYSGKKSAVMRSASARKVMAAGRWPACRTRPSTTRSMASRTRVEQLSRK